jgi:non-ribosomal peptide synthetase-like protein
MSMQRVAGSGIGASALFPTSALRREASAPAEQSPTILVCRERDNTVRWRPGERLQHLFEQRCDQFASAGDTRHLAVDSAEGPWTYGELDARANQLARYLRSQGLHAGDVIALLFDKSVHSYVSMLAVLKIHAAYVPLDPCFPADRIAFIAGDAGVKAVLTTSAYRQLVAEAGPTVLCVDEASPAIDGQAGSRLDEADAGKPVSELCYIIYTSGSTGRPKGVPIEHAGICNFVRVAAEIYGYKSTDRVYQGLTIAFDFAVEEIWVPLVVGATLLPNQTGSSLLGDDLAAFLRSRKATAMCCVPTLLATIDETLPDLRLLIVSGEACPRDLIARWDHPQRTILNAYGPTEATVTATLATPKAGDPVTIGRPLPTYSIVILVPGAEQALPFGETGEIGIAGIGVAQGYLNREEQTRQAFIRDFIGIPNNPSGRIYRTGDLGRVNERGEIEYLGRIDTQVKIRGYRIELSEIESVILRMPQIAQAVVNTFEPMAGTKELVAYYTLKANAPGLAPEDLARELRTQLPSYMVPAFYEPLGAIPMLASDKADRKSLPVPTGARMNAAGREFVEPQGALETDVAGVLSRLLKLERVSVDDDFFADLGTNSLLMAQFSARLRSELGLADFSMREIYLHPSVRRLSAFLASSVQGRTPLRQRRPIHVATDWQYNLCAAFQMSLAFCWIYFEVYLFWQGYNWVIEAEGMQLAYARATAFSAVAFALNALMPIALKWVLVGRWKAEEFPVWSLKYVRFWAVKQLIRFNPLVAFAGTPFYIAYLKLLGARVSWKCVVLSSRVPVCTDLLSIGEGALVSKNVGFSGYRADGGRIRTGSITLGRDVFVGDASLLDIDSVMEAGSELAHASSLHMGQRLPAGGRYHGSPAQPAQDRFRRLENGQLSAPRMILFSLTQLAILLLLYLPVPFLIAHYYFGPGAGAAGSSQAGGQAALPQLSTLVSWTTIGFFAFTLLGLALVILLPRCLNVFLKADRTYPLYGIHFFIHRVIERRSNSDLYNGLFGDSSFIVRYLKLVGYRFNGLEQTGSNFGLSQKHDNPFLCEIGKGTMVSDGLTMLNAEYSASSFRIAKVSIGARNFLGNNIAYPSHAKAGDNCLLGTKVMVPTEGPMRENVGLLGSPCFEIPRSVRRDAQFDRYKQKDLLRERLKRKNVSNALTIALYLLSNCVAVNLAAAAWYYTYPTFISHGPLYLAILGFVGLFALAPYYVLIDRASLGFRRLEPQYCSIYDDYYWTHERFWKVGFSSAHFLFVMLSGTPFRSLMWRALGVRVGRKLFDDGAGIPEKTLLTIGDYCTLNELCAMQGHSLEDGIFKSDHISIGNGCTLGTSSFVHYGVHMGDGVTLEPDSFLMKGEHPQAQSSWRGNPAREMLA